MTNVLNTQKTTLNRAPL